MKYQKPKVQEKASYNSVLVEGNSNNWFHYLLNHLFSFGCLTVEICMDKYIRKIITVSGHHLKPVQKENKGYNGRHNLEDMVALIRIAFDFRYPFVR